MENNSILKNGIEIEKVYLDYNATTPLDQDVIETIAHSLAENWSNPSSQYKKGKEAKILINESRQSIANMINSKSSSDIIFVSGGTEANNLVFFSVLKYYQKCKLKANNIGLTIKNIPHIIISNIEHDSVKLIAENYEKNNLAEITYINVNNYGAVNINDILDSIKPNTILISLMLANNETGVIQPVKNLMKELNFLGYNQRHKISVERNCPLFVHTDAAQAIGKIKVDVQDLQVDYLTIVGHKFYGPRIGALYARNCLLSNFDSNLIQNGESSNNMKKAPIYHMFNGAGQENGLRPGTENTPMIVGLGKAAELVCVNLEKDIIHTRAIRDYLEARLIEEFGEENVKFNGKSTKFERLPNTCNVSFIGNQDFKGYIILNNTKYLEASTGACCHSGELKASKILLAMNIDKNVAANAIRLSVGRYTTKNEIEIVIKDLKETLEKILA